MKLMQRSYFWSALRNHWWYSWDVRAKPIISKIEIERADIESSLKSLHSAALVFGQEDLRTDMRVHAWNAASWISLHQTVYLGRQLNN